MKTENPVLFDELDQKVFGEMSFLTNVIAAWGNKVVQVFRPYHDEFEEQISAGLKGKRYWKIQSIEKDVITPFSCERRVKELESRMAISTTFNIVKKVRENYHRWYMVEYGYWMQAFADEGNPALNCFYFCFYQDELNKVDFEPLMTSEFYKSLKPDGTDCVIAACHPDEDPDELEYVEYRCDQLDPVKIDKMKADFVKNVLTPVLKSIQ